MKKDLQQRQIEKNNARYHESLRLQEDFRSFLSGRPDLDKNATGENLKHAAHCYCLARGLSQSETVNTIVKIAGSLPFMW